MGVSGASMIKNGTKHCAVLGLGQTGLSVIRYLSQYQQGVRISVFDSRENPPGLAEFQKIRTGGEGLFLSTLDVYPHAPDVDQIIVSPGIDWRQLQNNHRLPPQAEVTGDIALFVAACGRDPYRLEPCRVFGITGSNGKSTVSALLDALLRAVDVGKGGVVGREGVDEDNARVALGGNFGTPALDLLDPLVDHYVIELSSFQLALTQQLPLYAAVLLNIGPDHLDRHGTLEAYLAAKQRIYAQAHYAVVNRAAPLLWHNVIDRASYVVSFGLDRPQKDHWGLHVRHGIDYLACGEVCLLPVTALKLVGRHNIENVLAALALFSTVYPCVEGTTPGDTEVFRGDPDSPWGRVCAILTSFTGLPHRCQWVATHRGVRWINDSKATNADAAIAAITGLACRGSRLWLLAGGQAKGADFKNMAEVFAHDVAGVMVFGEDADRLAAAAAPYCAVYRVPDLEAAVHQAHLLAQSGDTVLLAPACASLDMFKNYMARGDAFCALVNQLVHP